MDEIARRSTRLKRILILGSSAFIVLFAAFAIYVLTLFGHLKKAFLQQDQFVPTRIYSDVSRIAPPQLRSNVEERLQSLGYLAKNAPPTDERVTFTLHPLEYPPYLIPDGHPTLDAA